MSTPVIEVNNLSRSFGDVHAVRNVSFEILSGQVVGFIGANGAGKTTIMRMMVTLDQPDSGSIRINGVDVVNHPNKVRPTIGWMPDAYGKYDMMTVFEYLDFYARAFGYQGDDRQSRIQEIMEFTDLSSIETRYVDQLSKGMGQRLCLGRTLLHDPDVLVLDEPAAGLDPKARIELRNLIILLAKEGKTIFISSHILSELSEMCDTMLFIDNGKIVHHGSSEKLKRKDDSKHIINVRLASGLDGLSEWVSMNPGVSLVNETKDGGHIAIESDEHEFIAATLKRMVNDGLQVIEFHFVEHKLEDAFVDIIRKAENGNMGIEN